LYRKRLNDLPLKCQIIPNGYKSVYAQFSVVFNSEVTRDRVQLALKKNGVPSVVYYVISGHLQTGYKYLNYNTGEFPVSEDLCKRILSLPMHPYLNNRDIEKIVTIIERELNENG
jgi:dTDP-4-amino-4,6-dideoxygalactose transaminase